MEDPSIEEKRGSVMIFFHRVPEATSILSPILAAIGLGSRVINEAEHGRR